MSSPKSLVSLWFRLWITSAAVGPSSYYSNMRSSSREEIVEVLDALRAAHKRARDLTFDVLTTPERLAVLENLEQMRRGQPAIEHALINQLAEQADPTELGGKLPPVLANRLRISRAEASRRIHEAADLGERQALNGEPLPPRAARDRRSPTQRRPRRRPCRGHPQLLAPNPRIRRHRDPAQGRGAAGRPSLRVPAR